MFVAGDRKIEVFSTCPQSKDVPRENYLRNVIDVARWSEEFGCAGILVYTDNGIVDPWLVTQVILENTEKIAPLIAIQPLYMHPYSVAKKIATLAFLHGRRVYLNMVAGGFKNDLTALNDDTPHDDRYLRTVEYTQIIKKLCAGEGPLTYEGKYYTVKDLSLVPPIPPELQPGLVSSGSSDAGMQAARDMGSLAVKYPKPPDEEQDMHDGHEPGYGVRVGIITRETAAEAWKVALERFPEDRRGQLTAQLAMKVSDSSWHAQLSKRQDEPPSEKNPYWLGPFQNYRTFCPYLVGTYERVAEELAKYINIGYETFILDIPPSQDELRHTGIVFEKAAAMAAQTTA